MSTNALEIVYEASTLVGDPMFQRITQEDWRHLLNTACRDIARKLRVHRRCALFDIEANSPEYAMPEDCLQIISMQYNDTPQDANTWWWLQEMFEDEFRDATHGTFSAARPIRYLARTDTFLLFPQPDASYAGGGKVTYWGLPDEVTSLSTQNIPFQDTLRDTLRDRMVTFALRRLEKFDAAAQHEKEWVASLTTDRDRLEDRAADRRSRMRPISSWSRRMRQA